ncbi:MAG: hypothetical protein IKN38_10670 [Clostridia bacterium]|nr:hypothetical protein [Clostridia bacterium]
MFGYIKPHIPALSVAEYEAYHGAYCGLCRTMGSLTGQLSRFTLNYDFAFLAVYRMAAEKIPSECKRKGCIAHPFSRRTQMTRNPALEFAAAASAVLTREKIADNIKDEKGFRRTGAKMLSPLTRGMVRRVANTISGLREEVAAALSRLDKIERERSASVDEPARAFGEVLSAVASYGYEENVKLISEEIGKAIGKIVYVLDAADDIEDDIKDEKYNPLALLYDEALGDEQNGRRLLRRDIADGLYTAIGTEANRAAAAFELLDGTGIATYKGIIMNTLTLGIRAEAERILYGRGKKEDPVKFRI